MLNVQDVDNVLHIRASGRLEGQDYDAFVPVFERVATRIPGRVPMLIELAPDFAGWDISGLWRDLKFDLRHKNRFGRIGIVGDKKWEDWGTKLFNPLFGAEMRFFGPGQIEEANEWIRSGATADEA